MSSRSSDRSIMSMARGPLPSLPGMIRFSGSSDCLITASGVLKAWALSSGGAAQVVGGASKRIDQPVEVLGDAAQFRHRVLVGE